MKIAILASEFPPQTGGMEQHALGVSCGLANYCDVTVFTSSDHKAHQYSLPFHVEPVLEKNLYIDMQRIAFDKYDAILSLNAGYAPIASAVAMPVYAYCHGNDYLLPWIDCLPRFQQRALKYCSSARFLWRFSPALRLNRLSARIGAGLQAAQLVFVNSHFTKQRIAEVFGRLNTPVRVCPPGAADHFFDNAHSFRKKKPLPEVMRLISTARLSSVARMKNIDGVLRALATLKEELRFEYVVIGDGDLRSELEALAKSLGIGEQVRFLGMMDNTEVKTWLDRSDLFVMPSKPIGNTIESFGIVYVEAAARGVPSILSRAGGGTDAVRDGVSGVIIDDSDPVSIANGIRRFLNDYEEFDPQKIVGFAERFRWENIAKEMWLSLREVGAH